MNDSKVSLCGNFPSVYEQREDRIYQHCIRNEFAEEQEKGSGEMADMRWNGEHYGWEIPYSPNPNKWDNKIEEILNSNDVSTLRQWAEYEGSPPPYPKEKTINVQEIEGQKKIGKSTYCKPKIIATWIVAIIIALVIVGITRFVPGVHVRIGG